MEFSQFRTLVAHTRTVRRFRQAERITLNKLHDLVALARVTPSGRNAQPLRYILVTGESACAEVFAEVAWAGALKDWSGPEEGERPAAYIVVLEDTTAKGATVGEDVGIAAQTMMLGARCLGLGCCMLGSVKRERLRKTWQLSDRYRIQLVLALGVPAEEVVIEPMPASGDVDYWRDRDGIHHVPKHSVNDLVLDEKTR